MSDLKSLLRSYAPASANGSLLPAALAALLVGAAVLEVVLPAPDSLPQGTFAVRAPRWTLPQVGTPAAPPAGLVPSLFSPLRIGATWGEVGRNGEDDSEDTPTEAPAKPKPGPLAGSWVLGAVRVDHAQAVIVRPKHGSTLRLPLGGTWRGWRLTAIEDNAALFRHGGKTLRVDFGNAPPGATDGPNSENPSE